MPNKEPMSTFVAGGKEFEIVDKGAREKTPLIGYGPSSKEVVFVSGTRATVYLAGDTLSSTYTSLQGGCYNSNKQYFVQCLSDSNYANCLLVELDSDFNVVNRSGSLPLGHGGDLTYNDKINKIFASTSTSGENVNKVCMIDADTLTFEKSYDLGISNQIKRLISYDPKNDVYYVQVGEDLVYIYAFNYASDTWTELSHASLRSKIMNSVVDGSGWTNQSTEVYEGKYLFLSDLKHTVGTVGAYNHFAGFCINTFDGNFDVISSQNFRGYYPAEEAENMCVVGNYVYVFGGHDNLIVSKIPLTSNKLFIPSNNNAFESGWSLPSGANINNYRQTGIWVSRNLAHSNTMSNTPSGVGGFRLYVIPLNWSYIEQVLVTTDGTIYRRLGSPNDAWADWVRMMDNEDFFYSSGNTLTINDGSIFYGHVTSDTKSARVFIPLGKRIEDNITSVSVSNLQGPMRGSMGYVNSDSSNVNWAQTTGCTVTAEIRNNRSALLIYINSTDRFTNIDNNTPITFYSHNSVFSFT